MPRWARKLKKSFSTSSSSSPGFVINNQLSPVENEPVTTVLPTPIQSDSKPSAFDSNTFADTSGQLSMREDPQSLAKTAWNGFITALQVTEKASDAFTPLKSAIGVFLKTIEVIDLASENEKELEEMSQRIRALSVLIGNYGKRVSGGCVPQDIQDRVDAMTQTLEQHTKRIEEKQQQSKAFKLANASDNKALILRSCRAISFIITLFEVSTNLSTERRVGDISEQLSCMQDDGVLKTLKPVEDASYKSNRNRRGCMEGTRVDILAQLLAWATDDASQPIYWLNGMAGTGKSTIAQTFCERLHALDNRLGASFFCSRTSDTRKDINSIIPTIAYQLARRLKRYSERVITVIKANSDTAYDSRSLQDQASELLLDLKEVLQAEEGMTLVIVIDALDECGSPSAVRDFLRVILRSRLPVKFLVISRPEIHLDEGFSSIHLAIDEELARYTGFSKDQIRHQLFRLHDIEKEIVAADITRYLRFSLASTPWARGTPMILFDKQITALVKQSDKLFIFAFTVVRYLSDERITLDALQRRYLAIVQPSKLCSNLGTRLIDELYNQIFTSAFIEKEPDEVRDIVEFVHSIVFLRKPLSVLAISELFCCKIDDIRTRLQHFYSVIDIPTSDDDPVLTFHASFIDYISKRDRSKEFAANIGLRHLKLGLMCFKRMNVDGSGLRENICGIATRQTPNSDISHASIQNNIPSSLQYACMFWASHLNAGSGLDISSCMWELDLFVQRHILHWLECLSLMNELGISVGCLQQALKLLPKGEKYEKTRQLINEARLVIPQSFYFVKSYALEIYYSALVWLPKSSTLKMHFPLKDIPRITLGLDLKFRVCEQILNHTDIVKTAAFSPDGSRIVFGSGDSTVRIWNMERVEVEIVFIGHSNRVTSVAYSPDGSRIISGSEDSTVRVWNVGSVGIEKVFTGHSRLVTSVAFSPDGLCIASGSEDKAVRVWNVENGKIQVFNGHLKIVRSVAFSPDGSYIVSGSDDKSVRVWNVGSGEIEKVFTHKGDSGTVTSVAFSPDGLCIVFGSEDEAVRVWNIENGKIQVFNGHLNRVRSVAFSPDGSYIVSGSYDKTVRVWNLESGENRVFKGHSSWVSSVSFSHDGSRIVSGSYDKTVRVWNVEDEEEVFRGHLDRVSSMVFSPDGSCFVSGSDDKTVRVWNVNGGEEKVLKGHLYRVSSVAFSPDGSRIVSGSDDNTVRVWNVDSEEEMKVFDGHLSRVLSVAFSTDGNHIISRSHNERYLWNVESGDKLPPTDLIGQTPFSSSISKSPFTLSKTENYKLVQDASHLPFLWFWQIYQQELCVFDSYNSSLCLGYRNGRVLFVDFSGLSFLSSSTTT